MEKIFRVLNCFKEEKTLFDIIVLRGMLALVGNTSWLLLPAGMRMFSHGMYLRQNFDQRYFPTSVHEVYTRQYQSIS